MKQEFLAQALADGLAEEMARDHNVVLIGEDVVNNGGIGNFRGVAQQYPDRCFDMPSSESGYTHFANGAALAGLRPVVDLMFSDFASLAFDAIVNGCAKLRYNTFGQRCCPTVYVMANGGAATYGGVGLGFHHSQCVEGWFQNVPGLKIVAPYYPADAKGLLKAAIRDNDPVLFLYHEGSLGMKGPVPEAEHVVAIHNAARVIRAGSDVTVVAIQSMTPVAMQAAEFLEREGISVEIVDPRVLIPLDTATIFKSVKKTGRLVVVHEAPTRGSFGNEIIAGVADCCFKALKAPIKKVGAQNTPIGSGYTEEYIMPHKEDVVAAVRAIVE